MRVGAVEQFLPGLGQPHAAIGAREQRHPKLLFEPLHVPGQRRLRQVQMGGGAGDAAEFGDPDKIGKAAQFHARDHTRMRPAMPSGYGAGKSIGICAMPEAGLACRRV